MNQRTVQDIMSKDVVSVFPETSLFEAAKVLYQKRFNGLPVVDQKNFLVGIITEYDFINVDSTIHLPTLQKFFQGLSVEGTLKDEARKIALLKVSDLMNPDPLALSKESTLEETMMAFRKHYRVNSIPIVDSQKRVVGIVSRSDLIKFFSDFSNSPTVDQHGIEEGQSAKRNVDMVVEHSLGLMEQGYALMSKLSEARHEELGVALPLLEKLVPSILEAADTGSALESMVSVICDSMDWALGEIWTPHPNGLFLKLTFSYPNNSKELKEFIDFSAGFIFVLGEDLPGRIWLTKRPEWENNADPATSNFLKSQMAVKSGVKAVFGFPVLDNGDRVIAVVLFFMQKSGQEDGTFVKFISTLGAKVNLLIKHKLLQTNQFLLQSAVRSSAQGVLITSIDGIVLFANRAWEKLNGFSPEEIVGRKAGELWGGHMSKEFYEELWRTIKTEKKPFVGEVKNVKKDKTEYWQAVYISPVLDERGELRFFMSIEPDITDAKQKEQFRNEFVSIVGHQLRNPLVSIRWLIEWLSESADLTDESRKKIQAIYEENQSLSSFVSDLLMLSRAGKTDLAKEPMDLKIEIEGIVKEVRRANPKTVFSVSSKGESFRLIANKSMTMQVFANLLYNAAEYSDKNTSKVEVGLENKGSEILFFVRNNGPEIAEADKPKIFSKLFRAETAKEYKNLPFGQNLPGSASKKNGTGLGLFIVKTICDNFGWKVWFESGIGQGTSFYVKIPMEKEP